MSSYDGKLPEPHKHSQNISISESVERVSTPALGLAEGVAMIQEMVEAHEHDLNFPDELLFRLHNVLLRAEEIAEGKETDRLIEAELQAEMEALRAIIWSDSPYLPGT